MEIKELQGNLSGLLAELLELKMDPIALSIMYWSFDLEYPLFDVLPNWSSQLEELLMKYCTRWEIKLDDEELKPPLDDECGDL